MSFWSGETLVQHGASIIEEFDKKRLDCNAYVLRMGAEYFATADDIPNSTKHPKTQQLRTLESFVIFPGQFAYLLTKEEVTIPHNAMAFISMKTEKKFAGLINVSGFHVNPGYKGKLIYAVYNAGPQSIQLREDDGIFKIWFCDLNEKSSSPFIEKDDAGINSIGNEVTKGMNQQILSLNSLAADLEKVRTQIRIQTGVISAIAAIALVILGTIFAGLWDDHKVKETPSSNVVVQTGKQSGL